MDHRRSDLTAPESSVQSAPDSCEAVVTLAEALEELRREHPGLFVMAHRPAVSSLVAERELAAAAEI